ncbi:MAG: hypothetical protein ACTSWX_03810 [Promethearchaeota archaeon]
MLIRVETEWHLINIQNEKFWQHWSIEKNLISIDGEKLDYNYHPPPPYNEKNNDLIWIVSGFGIVCIGISLFIVGKKFKKN